MFQIVKCRIFLQYRIVLYACQGFAFLYHDSLIFFFQAEELDGYVRVLVVFGLERKRMGKQVVVSGDENLQAAFLKHADKLCHDFHKSRIQVGFGLVPEQDGVRIDFPIQYEVQDGSQLAESFGYQVRFHVPFFCLYIETSVHLQDLELQFLLQQLDGRFQRIVFRLTQYGETTPLGQVNIRLVK